MDSNLPPNQTQQPIVPPQITQQQLEEMKARARQQAIEQTVYAKQATEPEPKVVYIRRNLTVAEVILVFIISCGLVFGTQISWNFITNVLPRIEINVKE